jgi:hypothetical protein
MNDLTMHATVQVSTTINTPPLAAQMILTTVASVQPAFSMKRGKAFTAIARGKNTSSSNLREAGNNNPETRSTETGMSQAVQELVDLGSATPPRMHIPGSIYHR